MASPTDSRVGGALSSAGSTSVAHITIKAIVCWAWAWAGDCEGGQAMLVDVYDMPAQRSGVHERLSRVDGIFDFLLLLSTYESTQVIVKDLSPQMPTPKFQSASILKI